MATSKVADIRGITPQVAIAYRDAVYARNLSGKSQSNLFSRIRRLISFASGRAVAMDALNRALAYLALLTPSETTISIDPKPIEPSDWRALLGAANGDDKAMLLLGRNCAMYLQEVINLRWSDIKGNCVVTHRKKTGRCVRVAVLWKETIEALATVKRREQRDGLIFFAYNGLPLGIKGAERRFRNLRDAAKIPHVTASMLRDGAYKSAVEGNVTAEICKLLVGHSSGIKDHYVKRKPSMVAPACDAIYNAYMAEPTSGLNIKAA